MMKGLDQYCSISNKELQGIKGGFGVGVGIALFMAAYTIGKDLRKKFGSGIYVSTRFSMREINIVTIKISSKYTESPSHLSRRGGFSVYLEE